MEYTMDNTLVASLLRQLQHLTFLLGGETRALLLNSSSKPLGTCQHSLDTRIHAHASAVFTKLQGDTGGLTIHNSGQAGQEGSQEIPNPGIAKSPYPPSHSGPRCVACIWSFSGGTCPLHSQGPSSRPVAQLEREPADPYQLKCWPQTFTTVIL